MLLLGERLEQPLLADPADVVARVALAVVEDPEVDAGLVEQPRERRVTRWERGSKLA